MSYLVPSLPLLGLLLAACSGPAPTAPDTDPPLLAAAEQGDLQTLDRLLSRTPTPDVRDQCRWTPLMKAALNGHLDAVQRLLQAGAEVNAIDKGGYSPLMLAASNNHAAVVRTLAVHGARLNQTEPDLGWNALIWAAKLGHGETVAALVELGADTGLRDRSGNSAADWARKNGHESVLALLR